MPKRTTKQPKQLSRRFPAFRLNVDWFVESAGCSTLGRGLELSASRALLPHSFTSPFASEVTLFMSLPLRERMFKARCLATQERGGWVLRFVEVGPDDLELLGHTLVGELGSAALPTLWGRGPTELNL